MFVNGFTILLMLIALFCGITWGVHVERQNSAARYRQQIMFHKAAFNATVDVIENEFKAEIDRWKRLVDDTMKNAYKVGVDDGRLM